jgi:hypothetical protein
MRHLLPDGPAEIGSSSPRIRSISRRDHPAGTRKGVTGFQPSLPLAPLGSNPRPETRRGSDAPALRTNPGPNISLPGVSVKYFRPGNNGTLVLSNEGEARQAS